MARISLSGIVKKRFIFGKIMILLVELSKNPPNFDHFVRNDAQYCDFKTIVERPERLNLG
jgi:hypothetical protein